MRSEVDRKSWTRRRARANLCGFELFRSDGDDGTVRFFAVRHGLTRCLHDPDEVLAWLDDGTA